MKQERGGEINKYTCGEDHTIRGPREVKA
ncbi:uncharacterized protein METZ01_LOCUS122557 [marine metagenome]|uniref:Uncharacterized protein n=1 Tax=marine metagenome TaxID=408172 RepID=A0A381XZP4_9ZZZZ